MGINILQTKIPYTRYTNLMKKTSIFMRVQKREGRLILHVR